MNHQISRFTGLGSLRIIIITLLNKPDPNQDPVSRV